MQFLQKKGFFCYQQHLLRNEILSNLLVYCSNSNLMLTLFLVRHVHTTRIRASLEGKARNTANVSFRFWNQYFFKNYKLQLVHREISIQLGSFLFVPKYMKPGQTMDQIFATRHMVYTSIMACNAWNSHNS